MINQSYIAFHKLPNELKNVVTSAQAIEALERLEKKYSVVLGDLLIQLMIREVELRDLGTYLGEHMKLEKEKADALSQELVQTVLQPVIPYLERPQGPQAPKSVQAKVEPSMPTPVLNAPIPTPSPKPPPPPPSPSARQQTPPPQPRPPLVPPRVQSQPLPPAPVRPQPPRIPGIEKIRQQQTAKATYFVSAEDEQDIARHRDRLDQVGTESPTQNVDAALASFKEQHRIVFPDSVLEQRFATAVRSRMRDVRTSEEFLELLTRPTKVGGLGLSHDQASALARDVELETRKLHDSTIARHLAELPIPAKTPPPPPRPVEPPQLQPAIPPSPAPASRPLPPSLPRASMHMDVPKTVQPMQPIRPQAPQPIPRVTAPIVSGKPIIHDVKRPAKPMSLVDELGDLTIDDFRKLGKSLEESAAKVLEKIDVLAEESFTRRAEGVAAWRRSPTHKLYLDLGRDSMANAAPIEMVVAQRQQRGEPYMTAREFSLIADLNRKLTI